METKRVLLLGAVFSALVAAPVAGASNVIYSAFVKPKPGNLPSHAFEATSTRQFSDEITSRARIAS